MAALTSKQRKALPDSDFVFPDKAPGPGSYPINDAEHARKALQLGGKNASPGELAAIKRKVHEEYPKIGRYRAPE